MCRLNFRSLKSPLLHPSPYPWLPFSSPFSFPSLVSCLFSHARLFVVCFHFRCPSRACCHLLPRILSYTLSCPVLVLFSLLFVSVLKSLPACEISIWNGSL